jgi:hypothetical protein
MGSREQHTKLCLPALLGATALTEDHTWRSGVNKPRVICWFSCGDASAVATVLALRKYGQTHDIVVARIVIPSEHLDNERFAEECADTWDVWEKRKYIAGIAGAPCTGQLKKAVRFKFQRADDIHVFGYTAEETKRADTFKRNNFELATDLPCIDHHLSKPDCHALVRASGIELPMMYRLGFDNNNCIGCPKGGASYWNMIRKHFPDQFARMAELSRRLGSRLIKQDGQRVFLDELRTTTGRQKDKVRIECSAFCDSIAESFRPHHESHDKP